MNKYSTSIYTLLFAHNGKYYVYNSQSAFFSVISSELYDCLETGRLDTLPTEVLCKLEKTHVIERSQNRYNYFLKRKMEFIQDMTQSKALNLVVAPTLKCNFRCPYCFENHMSTSSMSFEVLDKLIKYIENRNGIEALNLTWYGGEPLLAFDTIREFYQKFAQRCTCKISYQEIITNGYLLTPDKCAFFHECGIDRFQITIDGLKEEHDKSRILHSGKGSFDVILQNIGFLLRYCPNAEISVRVNVNKNTFHNFIKVKDFFRNRFGQRDKIQIYPGLLQVPSIDKHNLDLACYNSGDMPLLEQDISKYNPIQSPNFPKVRRRGCMMHGISSLLIGPEGEIYKCWNDVGIPEKSIGNICNNTINNESLMFRYLMECSPFHEECKCCAAFPICDGGCGKQIFENKFNDGKYVYCSPFRDKAILIKTLLSQPNVTKTLSRYE